MLCVLYVFYMFIYPFDLYPFHINDFVGSLISVSSGNESSKLAGKRY